MPCRELAWSTVKAHLELTAPDLHDSLVRACLPFLYIICQNSVFGPALHSCFDTLHMIRLKSYAYAFKVPLHPQPVMHI